MRLHAKHLMPLLPALGFAAFSWSCSPDPPHDQGERFPLEGKHEALPCEACHGTDGFEALPTDCSSCHEQDRPPNHYEGDCGDCHTAFGWLNFGTGTTTTTTNDPHQTTFPLENAHALPCSSCHVGEGYAGLDPACESCHEDDRPNAYHFPGDCAPCHPTTVWSAGQQHPVTLDPPHFGAGCTDCHIDAFNMKNFSCITGCHDQKTTDAWPAHVGLYGYVYDSPSCWSCHPI